MPARQAGEHVGDRVGQRDRGSSRSPHPGPRDRAGAASSVFVDEFAKNPVADDLYAAVKPTVDGGGQLLVVSTAWGIGNRFHTLWTKASKGESEFQTVFLPWHARPGRNAAWYARQLAEETDPDRVRENYPSNPTEAFRVSGRTRFHSSWIESQAGNVWPHGMPTGSLSDEKIDVGLDGDGQPILLSLRDIPSLIVYEPPNPHRRYLIAGDVAEGKEGGDYDDAVVIDAESWTEVATLNGHWEPHVFAHYLIVISEAYNGALVAPERNNHGAAVITTFKLQNFYRIYQAADGKYGWLTNVKTKPQCVDILAECLRDNLITIRTQATLNEMQVYRTEPNGATSAPDGYHDDRVMSWAIVLAVARTPVIDHSLRGAVVVPVERRKLYVGSNVNPEADWQRRTEDAAEDTADVDMNTFFAGRKAAGILMWRE